MNEETRDRVRALVRDVLANALPADEEASGNVATSSQNVAPTQTTNAAPVNASTSATTGSRFISTLPDTSSSATKKPDFDRDESSKMIITEDDVRGLERGARLRIAEGAHLTALASDVVRERGIELVRRVPRRGSNAAKLVAVGADHGGYAMKEELKVLLTELGHRVHDFGTNSKESVDYPDFAHAVARDVADGASDLGIIIDGAGIGSAMTANKVTGVRAAACYNVALARNSREHNDANVLTLGSSIINSAEMREIVTAWLSTEIKEERHRKRVAKIEAIERQYQC
jgi:ribose 5-phosphate isomerase B